MDYREKIKNVMAIFGMKSDIAANAMDIPYSSIRKKLSDKEVAYHNFNKEHYNKLVDFIKEKAASLKKIE